MASKTWLAIILSLFIWFAYMKWFAPPPVETNQATTATQEANKTETPSATGSPGATVPSQPQAGVGAFAISFPNAPSQILKDKVLEATFSTAGGKVTEVRLRDFYKSIKKDSGHVTPVNSVDNPHALATLFSDEKMASFSNGLYEEEKVGNNAIRYKRNSNGVTVLKDYEINDSGYYITSRVTITFPNDTRSQWGYLMIPVGGGPVVKYDYSDPLAAWELAAFQDESVKRKKYDEITSKEEVSKGNTKWLSYGNRYFAQVVISESEINPDVVYAKESNFVGAYLKYPLVPTAGKASVKLSLKYYVGPKDVDQLSAVPGLRKLIDYGMFSFLAYPLLALMRFFYTIIHNWGVAIILLTVLVRAVFYPLSLKSYRSMKSMQKLQPHIKALKEKYKDDMQKFNQEQMALFKAHKVNPMSGCLPILVQIPVFFALYSVLSNSTELFHAPFFGWIQDLSAQDPYYIYPALMGISMFVQQKMTPTAGMDPMQAKIMLLMPVIFTFMMLYLPSGLTLYIFVSTLLGIAQQWIINREPDRTAPKVAIVQNKQK